MGANPFQAALLNGGVMPPTNPVQPQAQPMAPPVQPGTQQDPMQAQALQGMKIGQEDYAARSQKQQNLADTVGQLQQQRAQLQMPKEGYEPKFKRMNSAGSVLGDIGKALLLGLSATGPGQAVMAAKYGPAQRAYARESGSLAQQISELQEQQKVEEQPMAAAAGLGTKPWSAEGSYLRGKAAMEKAQLDQQMAPQKLQFQREAMKLRDLRAQGKLDEEHYRTESEKLIAQWRNQTQVEVAKTITDTSAQNEYLRATEDENRLLLEHPFERALDMLPPKPVTPAGSPPAKPAKSKGAAAPKGATHIGTSSVDGKSYYLDAKGNKLGPAPASK